MTKATVFDLYDAIKPFVVTEDVLRLNLNNARETVNNTQGPIRKKPPSVQQIRHILPEDYAKLRFNNEYFWVKVDQVNHDNRQEFVGIVYEDLTFSKIYQGDEVYFEGENVFDIRSQEWRNHDHI